MLLFFFSTNITDPADPKYFAQTVSQYLVEDDEKIRISEKGAEHLDETGAWMQILNNEGKEIYNYHKPENVPDSYLPYQIADISQQSKDGRTVFVSGRGDNTILLSFTENQIQKMSVDISAQGIGFFGVLLLTLIVSGTVVYLIMSRLFIKKFTGPISMMMTKINQIGDYAPQKGTVNSGGLYQEVFSNLTELENKIAQAKEERKKFDQKRNEWIANISHDIKTPLSSIKGYAELMADQKYTFSKEEHNNYSETIIKNADYIANLVNDLSLEMKLLNDKHILSLQKIRLNDIIRDEISFVLSDSHFLNRDVRFLESQDVECEIDPILFQRALDNIVINALKYSGDTSTVVISLIKESNGKPTVVIADNGKGMTDLEIENLFTRYFRGENTDQIEGSGLGMSIAKNIIEAHGGKISVDSKSGVGTTVTIIL
jgi:signal transduction histidine kinase